MTIGSASSDLVLAVFAAVEQRDNAALARACQPGVEFRCLPSLPYGGTARGLAGRERGWAAYWDRLQPTAALRRLDSRVVAAAGQEVVVLWRQRGLIPAGDGLDSRVFGLYRVRAGELARGRCSTSTLPRCLFSSPKRAGRPLPSRRAGRSLLGVPDERPA